MNKFAILLLNLIFISPVFAGNITQQQEVPIFSDQDLEKYKRASNPVLPLQDLDRDRNEGIKKDSDEGIGLQRSADTDAKNEISESEKRSIEREFNTITVSMLSQLKAGNIEGALSFFLESSKDRYRQIFKALKDNNTLRLMAEGESNISE